ncbi:MAG: CRISPR-associated endonuclease Cas2 [Coriobacteriia bacterium]|nr:CRISPR-associated endonuclease Cas2 [Coriobacteriia bacterium]
MLVLITYDVSTVTHEGKRRLTRVAKKCESFGQRVQNSVFECVLDAVQLSKLQHELTCMIDPAEDSLRLYFLGNNYRSKVLHVGAKATINLEDPLIL